MRARLGIIGCGRIAQRFHIKNILRSNRAELVALCDTRQDLVEAVAKRYHVPRTYNHSSELLKQEDVDAVVITTPVQSHFELVSSALGAGKHVFVEKPMALSVNECKQIVEIWRTSALCVAVGFMRRFDTGISWSKRVIDEGVLGQLLSVNSTLGTVSSYADYLKMTDRNLIGDFIQSPSQTEDFRIFMLNQLVHHADLLCWFGGAVESVCASGHVGRNFVVDAAIRFSNGCMGHIQFLGLLNVDWYEEMTLHGDQGSVFLKMAFPYFEKPTRTSLVSYKTGLHKSRLRSPNNMYRLELENFASCVVNKSRPLAGALEGLLAQKLVEGISESLRTNQWVNL